MFKERVCPASSRDPKLVRDVVTHSESVVCACLPLGVVSNLVCIKTKVRLDVVAWAHKRHILGHRINVLVVFVSVENSEVKL